jgi:hypothetical protein
MFFLLLFESHTKPHLPTKQWSGMFCLGDLWIWCMTRRCSSGSWTDHHQLAFWTCP